MPLLPSTEALIPPGTPAIVAAALRGAAQMLHWECYQRCDRLEKYFEGTQYDDKPYDWDGSLRSISGIVGVPIPAIAGRVPSMSSRRPGAVYRLGKIMVQRYTALIFGEDGEKGFPAVSCEEDPDSEDFVQAIAEAAELGDVFAEARDAAGIRGTAVLSYAWIDGEPRVEVHNRKQITVLEWLDESRDLPQVVVKIWPTKVPAIGVGGVLIEQAGWMAREWSGPRTQPIAPNAPPGSVAVVEPGADRIYRYVPEAPMAKARWELTAPPVALDDCPVVWWRNEKREGHDGRGDYEGQEGMLDQLNQALCATAGGTIRNADPTLVLGLDPTANNGEPVRKGGYNAIYAGPHGADYLEISGTSTEAGLKTTDKLKAFVLEDGDVTLLDPEKMAGLAQSGEALRRLLFPMVKRAQKLRRQAASAIVRVLAGLLRQAQQLAATKPGVTFGLPPRVEKTTTAGGVEQIVSETPRVPGKGKRLTVAWAQMFPPSATDRLQEVQTTQAANGGKPVISMRTGVEVSAPLFDVTDVDQEVADVLDAEEKMADAMAGSFGKVPGSVPGVGNQKSGDGAGGAEDNAP